MRQAVADQDFGLLWLIGAEQMIPNQEHAPVVLVDVFSIARVMYAMGRRGVDEPLQPTDMRHQLGMNKKLIAQTGGNHPVDPDWIIPDPDDRQIEQEDPR